LPGWVFVVLLLTVTPAAVRGEPRRVPLDVHVIVDSSTAMSRGREQAVSWLSGPVIDTTLQNGDRLTLWTAGEKPEMLYSGGISADTREEAKKQLRNIRFQDESADYRGALNQVKTRISAGTEHSGRSEDGRLAYTILVSGANAKDPPMKEAEMAGLLAYSKVENHSGWRVLTVGLDIGPQVLKAAASYMKNR
jgi:hypothetical protein